MDASRRVEFPAAGFGILHPCTPQRSTIARMAAANSS